MMYNTFVRAVLAHALCIVFHSIFVFSNLRSVLIRSLVLCETKLTAIKASNITNWKADALSMADCWLEFKTANYISLKLASIWHCYLTQSSFLVCS